MFFIFKFIPDLFWLVLLIAGLSGYFLSHLIPVKTYVLPIKIISGVVVLLTIFVFGMLYCDNTWKAAAAELEAKVRAAEAQSAATNETIKEKLVVKTQIIKQRGADIVQYIDREVTKHDAGCVIPPEFVNVHNRAAEPPK
jgi:energy-coupling factor transporter transmembrane protein EcfT